MSILLLLLVLCAPDDGVITMERYRKDLKILLTAIETGDVSGAQEMARKLMTRRVRHRDIEFSPDPSVMGELERASGQGRMKELVPRLESLLRALEDDPRVTETSPPNPMRLEDLRRQEAFENPIRGGDVMMPVGEVPQSWSEWFRSILEWIGDKIESFTRWLYETFSGPRSTSTSSTTVPNLSMGSLVTVLVVLLLTIVGSMALLALREGPEPSTENDVSTGTTRTTRDEDPLTRTSGEWERRAKDLAADGRYREAIRAWYHAVLVTAFRAGILHYRRDRTNWEYAYSLGPQVDWRPAFLEATREFEREWYGRRTSAAETAELFSRAARKILDRLHAGSTR